MITGSPKQPSQIASSEERRTKATFQVGLWTGVLFTTIAIVSTISTIQTGLYAFGGITITAIVALIGFLAAYLSRHERAFQGSTLLVVTILLVSLSLPILAKGQGLALAIFTVIVISSIASNTLPSPWAGRVIIASLVIGLVIIFADLYLPDAGIPSDPRFTNVMSLISGVIYAGAILYRFNTYPLRTKLLIAFVLVIIVPLSILGYISDSTTRRILTTQAEQDLNKVAIDASNRLDEYIANQLDIIRTEAQQPSLSNYLLTPLGERSGSAQEREAQRTLVTFSRKNPVFILSYAVLDINGKNRLDTIQAQVGQNEQDFSYFTTPKESGTPAVTGLIFKTDIPTIYYSAPIRTEAGVTIGVLRVEYNALIFQYLLNSFQSKENSSQITTVIDRDTFLRIASTGGKRDSIYKTYKDYSPPQLALLQGERKLPAGTAEEIIISAPEIITGIENFNRGREYQFFTATSAALGEEVTSTGLFMIRQPWVVLTSQAVNEIYLPAEEQAKNNILLAIGLTGFAALMAVVVSQIIAKPVTLLAATAEKVANGDLTVRSEIASDDEVGKLALTFNQMTSQLNQTLTELEQRVQTRTAELQATNAENEIRARQLQSIAEISKIVTREINLDKLMPLITDAIHVSFGYYHAGIFLVDESQRFAVLHAANSAGGQKMLDRGHKIEIGTNSIVGYVILSGKARIAINAGDDAVFFNNPNLPDTRSEMALPLNVRGTNIGALDIQSKENSAFTEDDINSLTILADQIAIAIENARLIQQSQSALADSQAVFRSYLRQEWSALMEQKKNAGYQHSTTGGHVLEMPLSTDDIDLVMRRGSMVKREKPGKANDYSILALPIKLSEEVIGVIRVQSPLAGHVWSIDEINLVRAIAERVGLALENARLIESSQRRATKERVIGDISARISSASDMNNILEIAVQELGRTLSGSDVVIQFIQEQDSR